MQGDVDRSKSPMRGLDVRFCGRRGGASFPLTRPLSPGRSPGIKVGRTVPRRGITRIHHRAGPIAGSGRTGWLIRPAGASDPRSFGATSVANSSNEASAFSSPYQGG
jgi:hypothetical protein